MYGGTLRLWEQLMLLHFFPKSLTDLVFTTAWGPQTISTIKQCSHTIHHIMVLEHTLVKYMPIAYDKRVSIGHVDCQSYSFVIGKQLVLNKCVLQDIGTLCIASTASVIHYAVFNGCSQFCMDHRCIANIVEYLFRA